MRANEARIRGIKMSLFWIIGLLCVVLMSGAVATGTNDAALLAVWVFFPSLITLYFVPTIVAYVRGHANRMAILVLDLFLGWTLVGWVAALVWAHSDNAPAAADGPPLFQAEIVPHILPASRDEERASEMRTCPFCAEQVRAAAIKCRHCGSTLEDTSGPAERGPPDPG